MAPLAASAVVSVLLASGILGCISFGAQILLRFWEFKRLKLLKNASEGKLFEKISFSSFLVDKVGYNSTILRKLGVDIIKKESIVNVIGDTGYQLGKFTITAAICAGLIAAAIVFFGPSVPVIAAASVLGLITLKAGARFIKHTAHNIRTNSVMPFCRGITQSVGSKLHDFAFNKDKSIAMRALLTVSFSLLVAVPVTLVMIVYSGAGLLDMVKNMFKQILRPFMSEGKTARKNSVSSIADKLLNVNSTSKVNAGHLKNLEKKINELQNNLDKVKEELESIKNPSQFDTEQIKLRERRENYSASLYKISAKRDQLERSGDEQLLRDYLTKYLKFAG